MQEKCTYDVDGKVHPVCDGGACKALAAQILSSMDMRISPCQDFYKFACGSSSAMPDNRFTVYSMQANVNLQLQSKCKNCVLKLIFNFFISSYFLIPEPKKRCR